MADSPDLSGMLRGLVQQQAVLGQQQAALLDLQTELVRLQRLLIERTLGERATDARPAAVTAAVPPADGTPSQHLPELAQARTEQVAADASVRPDASPSAFGARQSVEESPREPLDSPVDESPRLHAISHGDVREAPDLVEPNGVPPSRGARYMQPPPAKLVRRVTREDVDRLTRLYETGDAAHLVLQFGDYRGQTLLHVAQTDPDYVRRLALTAQRPEVRAAARQVVAALEAVVTHQPRTARAADRRSRRAG